MAKVDVRCPYCEKTDSVKNHGYGKSGHQRYSCQSCKRTFQLDYAYRACQPGMKAQVVDLEMNNVGIRNTARARTFISKAAVTIIDTSHYLMGR